MDELVGRGLGLRREVFRDVQLADIVAERADREVDGAFPAVLLLRRTVQHGFVEREILRIELLREVGGISVERADEQLVTQYRQRSPTKQRRDAFERTRLIDDHVIDVCAVNFHQSREIEVGNERVHLCQRHLVVGLGRVAAFGPCPMDLGDLRLKLEDCFRSSGSVLLAG